MIDSIRYYGSKILKKDTKLHVSQYNIISNTNNKTYNIGLDKEYYISQNEFIQNKKIIYHIYIYKDKNLDFFVTKESTLNCYTIL